MTGDWHFHIAVPSTLNTLYNKISSRSNAGSYFSAFHEPKWLLSQFLLPWIGKIHFWQHVYELRDLVRQWNSLIRVITTVSECGVLELWWIELVKFNLFHGMISCLFFLCLNVTTPICQLTRSPVPHLQF